MFFIAVFLLFFQEPWMNWINLQFLYATTFVNFGFWGSRSRAGACPTAR